MGMGCQVLREKGEGKRETKKIAKKKALTRKKKAAKQTSTTRVAEKNNISKKRT
jgi:hypothetical protein